MVDVDYAAWEEKDAQMAVGVKQRHCALTTTTAQ
jgi:hypothetical protein